MFSSIAPLKSLTKLETLKLNKNIIQDFTPLYSLSSLKTLDISEMGGTITRKALQDLQAALPKCIIKTVATAY
jgi:Leucine-rich repeat (LRR) protein